MHTIPRSLIGSKADFKWSIRSSRLQMAQTFVLNTGVRATRGWAQTLARKSTMVSISMLLLLETNIQRESFNFFMTVFIQLPGYMHVNPQNPLREYASLISVCRARGVPCRFDNGTANRSCILPCSSRSTDDPCWVPAHEEPVRKQILVIIVPKLQQMAELGHSRPAH